MTEFATSGGRVTASVRETEEYRVVLTMSEAGGVRGECDCPQGENEAGMASLCQGRDRFTEIPVGDGLIVVVPQPGQQVGVQACLARRS